MTILAIDTAKSGENNGTISGTRVNPNAIRVRQVVWRLIAGEFSVSAAQKRRLGGKLSCVEHEDVHLLDNDVSFVILLIHIKKLDTGVYSKADDE